MKLSDKSILFLTACVHPNGMIATKLQDASIRLKQYQAAINFYLHYTSLRILVVENTEVEISHLYKDEIKNGRLEYLTFDGNNYDKNLGKGYGEGLIIAYAFKHSKFVKDCQFIIKVSGRHKVLNINKLIQCSDFFLYRNNSLIVCEVKPNKRFARSDFFIASKNFYELSFISKLKNVNDSSKNWFENVLFDCIEYSVSQSFQFLYLPLALNQQGQSGTTGKHLKKPRFRQHLRFFCTMLLYKLDLLRF